MQKYRLGFLAWSRPTRSSPSTAANGRWPMRPAAGAGPIAPTLGSPPVTSADQLRHMQADGLVGGGAGSRTVTWTFRSKRAWARTPLVNDADGWVADGQALSAWRDDPGGRAVVGEVCAATVARPHAPLITDVSAGSLKLTLDPASTAEQYWLRIIPGVGNKNYVQANGTLGIPGIQILAAIFWGAVKVTGLESSTTSVRGARGRDAGGPVSVG